MIEMKLQTKYFNLIKNGFKTIELRLCDEKRKMLQPSDIIKFSDIENAQRVLFVKIVRLHKAKTFKDLANIINIDSTGFSSSSSLITTMEQFYPISEQNKYGVIGIEFIKNESNQTLGHIS